MLVCISNEHRFFSGSGESQGIIEVSDQPTFDAELKKLSGKCFGASSLFAVVHGTCWDVMMSYQQCFDSVDLDDRRLLMCCTARSFDLLSSMRETGVNANTLLFVLSCMCAFYMVSAKCQCLSQVCYGKGHLCWARWIKREWLGLPHSIRS